jgi:beta-glucosidase
LRKAVALVASVGLAFAADAPSAKVRELIRRMTPDEKLALMHGVRDPEDLGEAGYWPGLPRLGIPPLRLADGPSGVNVNADATTLPAPVALAATFDTAAARQYGAVSGREAKALRQDVLLAPYVNIVRDPLFRRNHTTLGEDPFLAAELAVAEIQGIQSQGVMAQVKHFAAYNGSESVSVDERALHEIELPAFEAAVGAGVASVMCAYNRVNGPWACESAELLNGVLRAQWGFGGFVTSDWGAVHSPFAILSGLDLEMPGREVFGRAGPYFTEPLKNAVADGSVPVAALDQALARILGQMERFHLLDRAGARNAKPVDVAADAAVARRIARKGAVLLRNEGNALPLTPEDLKSVAIIGPTGGQIAAGFLGERAYGFETRLVSPLDALRQIAGRSGIAYSAAVDLTGAPIPASALSLDGMRTGTLTAPEDGDYTLMVQPLLDGRSEGGGSIAIDGVVVARTAGPGFGGTGMRARKWSSLLPTTDGRDNGRGTIRLGAGPHRFEVAIASTGEAPPDVRLAWTTPAMRRKVIEDAVAAARSARTAVVFAWAPTGETLVLPEAQDELIEKVAAVSRKTIVVLNTGGPVPMPWREKVQAILEMWYPGQEGGWATADLLTGRASPGGKLPVTFPPFPFGHGLSYSKFDYSDLAIARAGDGLEVSFTLRNTGLRTAEETPQVYAGPDEAAGVPMAPRSMVAFRRVRLAPGKSVRVRLKVAARQLSYWSSESHEWKLAGGNRTIYVGSSSRDCPLSGGTGLR